MPGPSLISRGVETVTEAALSVFSSPPAFDGITRVLSEVQRVVGADTAGYYIHERTGWSTAVCITPAEVWGIIPFARMPTSQAIAIHPGVLHCVRDLPATAFSVTDLISEKQWRDSQLGHLMRADWGRNYQFAIPVAPGAADRASHAWVLGRMARNFVDADRDLGNALAPVLTAVARHRSEANALRVRATAGELLTQQEIVVLGMLAQGVPSRGIAARLAISPRTAQKHLEHIYRKLGAHSRQDAVRACQLLGISRADHVKEADPLWRAPDVAPA